MTEDVSETSYPLCVGCAQIKGTREDQEDYFAVPPQANEEFTAHAGQLYIVSDGMGGHEGGAAASLLAVRTLTEAYRHKTAGESIPEALLRSVRTANEDLYELARNTGADTSRGMGATIAAVVIHGNRLYWMTVGDSRIFLFRNGQLARVNRLHRYGDELDERLAQGELSEVEVNTDSRRHMLMSYLGLPSLYKVDCPDAPLELQTADRMILCSDGLTDALTINEIGAIVSLAKDPNSCAEALMACVKEKERPVQDNATVIVVEYRPPIPGDVFQQSTISKQRTHGFFQQSGPRSKHSFSYIVLGLIVIIALSFGTGIIVGKYLFQDCPKEKKERSVLSNPPHVSNSEPISDGNLPDAEIDRSAAGTEIIPAQ